MANEFRFLSLVKPWRPYLPEVAAPNRTIHYKEKILWTAVALSIFLVCCQMPLYGITSSKLNDPFYWMRVILASNRGSLMELGISPIITSSTILQLLAGSRIIDCDMSLKEDRSLYSAAQKLFGIIICMGEAVGYVCSGMYGDLATLGFVTATLLILQLFGASVLVLLLDEFLSKGYGLGSGIGLFIAANICESIVWKCLSPTTIHSGKGTEFEGAIVALFHLLMTKSNKILALKEAFYRSSAPNMTSLFATAFIFCTVIYFQGFKVSIPLQYQKARGQFANFPVRLFYTSNIPIILQTAFVSNLYFTSQLLFKRYKNNILVNLFGQWRESTRTGTSIPIGGLAYYISPPQSISNMIDDPIHCCIYILFVLASCALFSRSWCDVSGSGAVDVAKQLRAQNVVIKGKENVSIISELNRYIPTAATFGGVCIGTITIIADFLGAIGSGTGILLAMTIIYQFFLSYQKERSQQISLL